MFAGVSSEDTNPQCPGDIFTCAMWALDGDVPADLLFFETELNEQKTPFDLYTFVKDQQNWIFLNKHSRSNKIINDLQNYNILIEYDSLYHIPAEEKFEKNIFFKGWAARK